MDKKRALFSEIPRLIIVTPSKWLASLVKESFLRDYSIKVIHNGIDTSQFYHMDNRFRDIYNIGERFILLGVASTWNKTKGICDFIKLANKLGEEYQIVLIGVLENQIRTLPSNIIGIKRTQSVKELAEAYSAADLFLNLTYCDTYPTVNLEAISCGTPVLSYDTGGCRESILGCGDIIPRGDVEALIGKIENYRVGKGKYLEFDRTLVDNKTAIEQYLTLFEV